MARAVAPVKIELSPLELDPRSGLSRQPPRPVEKRQGGYEDAFDRYTIFYDVFRSIDGRAAIAVGPPLANLESDMLRVLRRAFEYPPFSRIEQRWLDRVSELWFYRCRSRARLPAGLFNQTTLRVQPNGQRMFAGRRVALTLSKDNLVSWIRDWAYFYAKVHGCDAILIYDNASSAYTPDALQRELAAVPGIAVALVVPWPHKYGPLGAAPGASEWIWDSDYLQHGMLTHARHRFLGSAHSVLQGDIDELVLVDDGRSVFDLAAGSTSGYLRFAGHWIENASSERPQPEERRHRHYLYRAAEPIELNVRPKWVASPLRCPEATQWGVHDVHGVVPDPEASSWVSLRHFKAINTNWRGPRWKPELPDPSLHVVDEDLARAMEIFASPDGP